MTGLWVTIAALAIALGLGLWWKLSNGRVRSTTGARGAHGAQGSRSAHDAQVGALQGVIANLDGAALGSRATLVQFSTAFCQPCRATRRILGEVAGMVDGVQVVDIDAESQLGLVRRLDIRRTPTVLILDARGDIRHRAVGQPRKADVIQALGAVID